MGWRIEHPARPTVDVCCRLDEHGGDTEKRHDELYNKLEIELTAELNKVARAIANKPEYAEIILYIDHDC